VLWSQELAQGEGGGEGVGEAGGGEGRNGLGGEGEATMRDLSEVRVQGWGRRTHWWTGDGRGAPSRPWGQAAVGGSGGGTKMRRRKAAAAAGATSTGETRKPPRVIPGDNNPTTPLPGSDGTPSEARQGSVGRAGAQKNWEPRQGKEGLLGE